MPRSWKSHGISGILKISGISGKVMEFRVKLTMVMEKSWNFEKKDKKSWKSHGIFPIGVTIGPTFLSPVATKLRKGDIVLPFVSPSVRSP